jgi:TctA family transporter
VFLLFILANLIMIPLGILCIKVAKRILRVPREILMPLILLFCVVGTFAINNSMFEVGIMLVAGILAYILEANRFPIAPAILGVVLGGMLEENFITSMIKSNGDLGAFLARPIALCLAVLCLLIWSWPLLAKLRTKPGPSQMA